MPTVAITFALVAGLLTTVITALINRVNWSSNVKVYVSVATALVLTVLGVLFEIFPSAWESVAAILASIFGIAQAVYPVLKPLLKQLEFATSGSSSITDELSEFVDNALSGVELEDAPVEVDDFEFVDEEGLSD